MPAMPHAPLTFLKLGGSLITDKRREETPRLDVIERMAREIGEALVVQPSLQLVMGHGAGSFGHVVARRYGTRSGVSTSEEWLGFVQTSNVVARLNRIVAAALQEAGVPAWGLQPSVALRCEDGKVVDGPVETVQKALDRGLVPLLHGDVALDRIRGGTIVSTEEIFDWLADRLHPIHMILAGEVDGVFTADPLHDPRAEHIPHITPNTLADIHSLLGASHGIDVTGGMVAKVVQCVGMVQRHPNLTITLCSGLEPGHLKRALGDRAATVGTHITS